MIAPRLPANPESEAFQIGSPQKAPMGLRPPYYNGVSIMRACYLCNIGPKTEG
jgi:hypothetical protein